MNATKFLSYIPTKAIRVKIFIPMEFYAVPQTLLAILITIGAYFISFGAGITLTILTIVGFLVASSIRNVPIGQSMVVVRLNKAQDVSHPNGVCWVKPIVDLCEFFEVKMVKKDLNVQGLDTKGDGFQMGFTGNYTITINPKKVHVYLRSNLVGKEPDIIAFLDSLVRQSSKDIVLQYSHEDLKERDTSLQVKLKKEIITNYKRAAKQYLEAETGEEDLYTIQLVISDFIWDPDYEEKLKEKNRARMDVDIAKLDKEATITDAEGEAEATRIRGKANADAIEMEAEALRKNPDVIRHRMAEHSNIQVLSGDGARTIVGGEKPQIIVP